MVLQASLVGLQEGLMVLHDSLWWCIKVSDRKGLMMVQGGLMVVQIDRSGSSPGIGPMMVQIGRNVGGAGRSDGADRKA